MGGGVGKILSGIAKHAAVNGDEYQHKILMLEKPEKNQFVDICIKNDIDIHVSSDLLQIQRLIKDADMVQLEWWHHPKMCEFLFNFPSIPMKLIIWSHVSGCNYPVLPFAFIKIPHKFMFTSYYSLENPYWSNAQKQYVTKNCVVINSSGDFNNVENISIAQRDTFNIGYVGTLNYSKLHPDFVSYCASIDIPNSCFIIVGDNENQKIIEKEAENRGILDKFEFVGFTNDVNKELSRFDVFAYPLNPEHFGTTENALLEAMAAGIPVVALNQCAEKYLIQHMETGLLADNLDHCAELVKYLYNNPDERKRIGENAKEYIHSNYSLKNNIFKMKNIYEEVMSVNTKIFQFDDVFGNETYQWFLSCLGPDRQLFEDSINPEFIKDKEKYLQVKNKIQNCKHILKERNKSSIKQFSRYFKYDKKLQYWADLIN
jgi:glycosyltransferase involved in cell wall biosynthesis